MTRKIILISYLVFIHILLTVLIVKSDFFIRLKSEHLGLIQEKTTNHYKRMAAFHTRQDQNTPKGAIFFLGASHIQGLAVSAVSPMAINYGIGGDTTRGLINRLPLYESLSTAKSIILAIGYNDLKYRSTDETALNFKKILDTLPFSASIILCAIHPVDEAITGHLITNKKISVLNSALKRLSDEYSNVEFLPLDSLLNDSRQLEKRYHIGDGIHLNKTGYDIWIQDLISILNKH
jgi:lysophospholipase L1-like esterase